MAFKLALEVLHIPQMYVFSIIYNPQNAYLLYIT